VTVVPAKKQMGIAGGAAGGAIIVKYAPYNGIGVLGVKPNPFGVDTYIVVKLELLNALSPIDVTEAGMVIDFKLVQLSNAAMPMVRSRESDANFIDDKLLHIMNAVCPIDVTEAGMVIDVKLLHDWNAKMPIDVTDAGMVIDVKSGQSWNALSPIAVTVTPPNISGIINGPA